MIRIGMGTSCVYPLGVETAFRMASELGYDGVEVMVTRDETTQSVHALRALAERYGTRVLSIHAPVLLLTHFVWGRDPKVKLQRSAELAAELGADTVVVHLPSAGSRDTRRTSWASSGRRRPRRRWSWPSRTCSRGRSPGGRWRGTCRTGTPSAWTATR